jgi:hypothetical protein
MELTAHIARSIEGLAGSGGGRWLEVREGDGGMNPQIPLHGGDIACRGANFGHPRYFLGPGQYYFFVRGTKQPKILYLDLRVGDRFLPRLAAPTLSYFLVFKKM